MIISAFSEYFYCFPNNHAIIFLPMETTHPVLTFEERQAAPSITLLGSTGVEKYWHVSHPDTGKFLEIKRGTSSAAVTRPCGAAYTVCRLATEAEVEADRQVRIAKFHAREARHARGR